MVQDRFNSTVLHSAASESEPAVIEALLAAGADVTARNSSGATPLHHAARDNDNPAVIEALVVAGASLDARLEDGSTPLHTAVSTTDVGRDAAENLAVTEALLAAGADVRARDENGDTPLHLAASWSHRSYDPEDPDNFDRLRRLYGEPHAGSVIGALLNAGANPMARNAAGRTPWDLAQENDALKGTGAYWRLNDARFNAPRQESRRGATQPRRLQDGGLEQPERQGPACEIPGYPTPASVESIGLNWCGPSVGFQRRAFALQAAGAWCAIAEGTSSSPEQVSARHQEINAACDALDALGARGGPPCRCPAGYRP